MFPHRAKTFLLVIGPVFTLALLALGLFWNHSAPRTGVTLNWTGREWSVAVDGQGLQAGDIVDSLNGEPVTFHTFLIDNVFISDTPELWEWMQIRGRVFQEFQGERVSFGVVRGTSPETVEVPVHRHSWGFLRHSASTHILVGLVFLLVGWATYRPSGTDSKALWFYLLCFSMSLVYVSNANSLLTEYAMHPGFFKFNNIINGINFVLAPALLFHFSLLMPRDRARRWVLVAIYGSVAFALVTYQIPLHGMLVAFFFLASLLAIAQGAWSYRGPLERQQMKWVGVGFLLGLGPWILLNGIPLVVWGQRLMSDTFPGACLVFIPIFMGVAVRKYRLFDVGTFLEGTALYLLTLVPLIGADILVLSFLDRRSALGEGALVSLALLIGLYGPLRSAVGKALSRYAHRKTLTPEQLTERLEQKLQACEPEQVLERLELVVQDYLAPVTMTRVDSMKEVGAYLTVEEEVSVLLVVAPGQALKCGPPAGSQVYSSQVMRRLEELVQRCSVHYQALYQARQAAAEKQRRLDERERLLGDLHDGVGAALSGIRLTSKEPRVTRLAQDALFELQSFLYPGPGYHLDWEHYVAELRAYGNSLFQEDKPRFVLRSSKLEGRVDRNKALSIFRLLKEALNNALKYAKASEIKVSLSVSEPGLLRLVVEDDGVGLGDDQGGRGMAGMRQRVEQLGGVFKVENRSGTYLEVELPL